MRVSKKKISEVPSDRPCDQTGCDGYGEYRAPKSRESLRDYYWFCLEHVQEYNKSWNYYAGMGEEQIEQHIRFDTVWQRPSWPISGVGSKERRLHEGLENIFADIFGQASRYSQKPATPAISKETPALKVLGLLPPTDFIQIKAKYRELVKIHHPDNNGGSKVAEDKFKEISIAYATLKKFYRE